MPNFLKMAKNSVFLTFSIVKNPGKSKIIVRYSGYKATKRANFSAFSQRQTAEAEQ